MTPDRIRRGTKAVNTVDGSQKHSPLFLYWEAAPKKVNKSLKLRSKFGDTEVTIGWYTCHHGGISYET